MDVSDLLDDNGERNTRLHFHQRYSPETLEAYAADLRRLAERVADGARQPLLSDLRRFVEKKHGVTVAHSTLRTHLTKIQNGEDLWPTA